MCMSECVYVSILPVFCGPTTRNLGNLSQVFSLDQMSLCRLSSHGFCKDVEKEGLEVKEVVYIQTKSKLRNVHD